VNTNKIVAKTFFSTSIIRNCPVNKEMRQSKL
jgi:hypothetical protein